MSSKDSRRPLRAESAPTALGDNQTMSIGLSSIPQEKTETGIVRWGGHGGTGRRTTNLSFNRNVPNGGMSDRVRKRGGTQEQRKRGRLQSLWHRGGAMNKGTISSILWTLTIWRLPRSVEGEGREKIRENARSGERKRGSSPLSAVEEVAEIRSEPRDAPKEILTISDASSAGRYMRGYGGRSKKLGRPKVTKGESIPDG